MFYFSNGGLVKSAETSLRKLLAYVPVERSKYFENPARKIGPFAIELEFICYSMKETQANTNNTQSSNNRTDFQRHMPA